MQTDGRWQWDDYNNPTTDQGDGTGGQPVATTALVANQQDYQLAFTHLIVTRVEVKDAGGNWNKLVPFDEHDIEGVSYTDFMKTAGMPVCYDKKGPSILLFPKPNFSQAASIKVFFERPPILYTTAEVSTGTKSPGFNSLYHELIPFYVAQEYAISDDKPTAYNNLTIEIRRMEEMMKEDYEMRGDDDPLQMRVAYRSSR